VRIATLGTSIWPHVYGVVRDVRAWKKEIENERLSDVTAKVREGVAEVGQVVAFVLISREMVSVCWQNQPGSCG
jgi:hypothetical protein